MAQRLVTPTKRIVTVRTKGGEFSISYFDRPGSNRTVLFVHGLGNAAANFADLAREDSLAEYRLVALDLPGCGESPYVSEGLNIDQLVELVEAFVETLRLPPFVLTGASMGGLVALLYAERNFSRVVSFVNLEGNLAPEDCMFSRLVIPNDYTAFREVVFPEIMGALQRRSGLGFTKHLEVLQLADPRAYYDYSFQTVEYSDYGGLLKRFLALPMPKWFVHGDANRSLSYLPQLRHSECVVVEVSEADHFLFYDNPAAVAAVIASAA